MKAAVTTEDHGFEVVELPDPTPNADQLVIRVAACGVCRSDIKAQPFAPAGMVMGHELGGEVVAVGSQAGVWHGGTNVAVLPINSCEYCQYCQSGLVSHCDPDHPRRCADAVNPPAATKPPPRFGPTTLARDERRRSAARLPYPDRKSFVHKSIPVGS